MTGKEQRVKALAERLQAPAPGQGQRASEVLAARLRELHNRLTPEAVAQGMIAEDPEKALQVAQIILAGSEDLYPHVTNGALCLIVGGSDPRTLAQEMAEANPARAQALAQAILGLTGGEQP